MKKIFIIIVVLSIGSLSWSVQRSTNCPRPDDVLNKAMRCEEESGICPSYKPSGNYIFLFKDACLIFSPAEYYTLSQLLMPRSNTGGNALLKDILQELQRVRSQKIRRSKEEEDRLNAQVSLLKAIVEIAPAATVASFLKNVKEERK